MQIQTKVRNNRAKKLLFPEIHPPKFLPDTKNFMDINKMTKHVKVK